MSAIVCGKRSFFEDLHHTPPPVSSKRLRCSSSPIRLSPSRAHLSPSSPSSPASPSSPLSHLVSLFPDMDKQFLERALEASGNDLDSAIKSLTELRLGSSEGNLPDGKLDAEIGTNVPLTAPEDVSRVPSSEGILPSDGSEWVELLVREMMNASDVDDARARASRVLQVLEKSIVACAGAEAAQNFQKENVVLKEQVELLLRENSILKRAVAIQHERQKEYDERSQELQQLKQLVAQYQEQLRTLEVNNYALTMHLRQAQQSNSIPGRFHPDVF
ncbi:hypothetical protein H6P81_010596 [Aristolochia fimbriata]|uniref:CUE domain-containing protein n=1 Tax=Aristolochia fimbriata TaxID=158543 RepID=A0AAV7ESM1_ARIFI|nr:hypothetical protein H6P81_010596 [Aristolochia fimbriata]